MRRLLRRLVLYAFQVLFARPVLKWVVGVRYRRLNVVPDGPCLVVSNHNSHLDAAVLMSMFPLRRLAHVHPVAAADYFGSSWFMSTLAMWCMNGIPIQRHPVRGEDPLAPVVELLKAGKTLIFFPEGSRGEAGVVSRFRTGVGRLVRELPGLLVVPVFLSGPERIWPRGGLPVPLSIDANVGRPLTYPPDDDPREVADRVREAVLALAPPPPPVPGVRPAPPKRIAICGVDVRRRDEVFRRVAERLGRKGPTLGVADPVIEADAGGVREATGPIPVGRERAWIGLLAAVFRTRGPFRGQRFVKLVERARINEALNQGRDTRYVVENGSVLADLMAAASAGLEPPRDRRLRDLLNFLVGEKQIPLADWWRSIRQAPEVWLINVFNLTQPPAPELLVHLTVPIPLVMQQLRSRGAALEPHENERQLESLQEAYREVGEVLRKRRRIELLELDGAALTPDEAAHMVEEACAGLFDAREVRPNP